MFRLHRLNSYHQQNVRGNIKCFFCACRPSYDLFRKSNLNQNYSYLTPPSATSAPRSAIWYLLISF